MGKPEDTITTDKEFEWWVYRNISHEFDKVFMILAFRLVRMDGKSLQDSVSYVLNRYQHHVSRDQND